MFVLKKLFQLRNHSSHDEMEKPFLEHLEDLRKTITKIVLTLAISMAACFSLQQRLMDILIDPVEKAARQNEADKIPKEEELARKVEVDEWEKAKKAERAVAPLTPAERAAYFKVVADPDLAFHVRSAAVLRAAGELDEAKREAFLAQITGSSPEEATAGTPWTAADMQKQVRAMLKSGAPPEIVPKARTMSTLKPTEAFMLSMKLAFYAGIIVSFPLLLYFILQFILPGLHGHERRILWPALGIGFGLFLFGVIFAYVIVLPGALKFFSSWGASMGIENDWRIGEYISFATQFILLFGASFELPVVVMVCVKLGLLGYQAMKRTRSYAIVAIFILAAVLTPTPDIMTQCLMAGPMIFLYECCIWMAWWDERKAAKAEAEEAKERMERLLLATDHLDPHATEEGEDETGGLDSIRDHQIYHEEHYGHGHADDDHYHRDDDHPPTARTHHLAETYQAESDADAENRSHNDDRGDQPGSGLPGEHDEPPVEYDPDLLPPPTTQEEPRKE